MKATRLLIAGTPFSGATWLGHLLDTHPHVFNAGLPDDGSRAPACPTCGPRGTDCPAWDDPAVRAAGDPATRAAALACATGTCVVAEGPLDAAALAAALASSAGEADDVRIVVCACDPLRYTRKRGGVTAEFATKRAREWRDALEAIRAIALASRRPVLVVGYEDLCDRREPTLRRVRAFLGLDESAPAGSAAGPVSHARGAATEAWGPAAIATNDLVSLGTTPAGEPRVERLEALDRAPADALGIAAVRAVWNELRAGGLPESLGFSPTLPRWVEPADDAQRESLAAWVRDDLARAREAVLDDRADEAIAILRVLVDYFGERFDALGLDLDFEALAIVHVDLLNGAGRGPEAATYARALVAARPNGLEGRRLLAVALAIVGDVPGTLASYGDVVRACAAAGETPETLAPELAHVLTCIHPDEPLLPAFVDTIADHSALAADVEAELVARLEAGPRGPEVYAALGTVRAARGDAPGAERLLEEGLTWHSRSPIVQAALFRLHGRLRPGDARYELRGRFCPKPFENIELLPDGAAHACCAVWVPEPIGNVYEQRRWQDVWNSPDAQDMRRSILDGTYRWCNKLSCPAIQNGTLPTFDEARARDPRWRQVIDESCVALPFAPETVNLSYDRSCNLACPSCRNHVIQSKDAERSRMDEMTDRIVLPLLSGARLVTITGSGDPFGSRTFRRLLTRLGEMDYPNLQYHIATNGQLLTPETWDQFPKLKERTRYLGVSVDAATEETYRVLRRPAELSKLIPNLRHMGGLLRQGVIEKFGLACVVQRENFRELPGIVRLAREVGANLVTFQRLHNWGTFTREEYAERAVFHEDHPMYEEFLRVMQAPELRDPIVDLGMLKSFVREDTLSAEAA